jgi:hypothetical protein
VIFSPECFRVRVQRSLRPDCQQRSKIENENEDDDEDDWRGADTALNTFAFGATGLKPGVERSGTPQNVSAYRRGKRRLQALPLRGASKLPPTPVVRHGCQGWSLRLPRRHADTLPQPTDTFFVGASLALTYVASALWKLICNHWSTLANST